MKKLSICILVIFAVIAITLYFINSPRQVFEGDENDKPAQTEKTEEKERDRRRDSIQEETEDDVPTKLIFYANKDSLVIDTSKIKIIHKSSFYKKVNLSTVKIYFLDSSFVYRERPYKIRIHYASGYYADANIFTERMSTFPKTRYLFEAPEIDTIPFEIKDTLMLLPSLGGYPHKKIMNKDI